MRNNVCAVNFTGKSVNAFPFFGIRENPPYEIDRKNRKAYIGTLTAVLAMHLIYLLFTVTEQHALSHCRLPFCYYMSNSLFLALDTP